MTNLQKLRDTLLGLTYSEMIEFAKWFAITDKDGKILDDPDFWAYTINDWAENAELEEDEDQP